MRDQSTLKPASHAAHAIADLWWVLFVISVIVFFVVVTLLLVAVLRRRGGGEPDRSASRGGTRLVAIAGVVVPAVVVIALFFASVATLPAVSPAGKNARMTIDVVGRQWFWEVRYPGTKAVTANEIHIPVGTRVNLVGKTDDVIHSFWVPELNRKVDLIPGQTTRILLEADQPGTYRGQCAEYCGLQHAHMAMYVIAQSPAQFRTWLAHEAKPAQPQQGAPSPGFQAFNAENACSGCHTVRGTNAHGDVGPDLTHVASRLTLAAGTIPNRPADLLEWIRDPQHVKPGARMPNLDLSDEQFRQIATYVEGLK